MAERGRVLIIDDTDEVRDVLASVVADMGYTAMTAPGGREGLALVATAQPDVVCLDLWMDDMTGLEVLDRLQPLRPDLPVIIITADPLTDMNGEARSRGAFEYILKPFEITQVRRALLAALSQPQVG